ncbi:thioredoxin family protein [uncultured Albimonas sp.]|uniref:thioredoxin family protein n=1 Tax=uncultured Albimonas sp. TaxID=1331701 RepID=UPI0030EF9BC3
MIRARSLALAMLVAPLGVALVPHHAAQAESREGYASTFEAAAFDAAVASGEPVLVEVSAPWCPTCRAQKEVLGDLLGRPDYAGFTVFAVDFDSRKDVLRQLDARAQSTLIVWAEGREVGRSVGDASPEGIERLLASAL